MEQTEDKYLFATVYDQELSFYMFHRGSMTNTQWYERFNTKVNVSESIGVTRQHKSLLGYVVQESHSLDFDSCTEEQQEAVRTESEESYLSYTLLIQIGNQHRKLKVDLQNYFATGNNLYQKSCPQTLYFLDEHSKIAAPKMPAFKGTSFAPGNVNKGNGWRDGHYKRVRDDKSHDKNYWKDN